MTENTNDHSEFLNNAGNVDSERDTVFIHTGSDAITNADITVGHDPSGIARRYGRGDIIDGDYELTKLLGKGGMGVVFACKHGGMGAEYAIKLLAADNVNEQTWSRFQAEAKALAKLNHPNIVSIFNMGVDGGICPYYVMELLSGKTLDAFVGRSGALSTDQILDCFIQLADALASAHSQGIIHRDIKPSNIMLLSDIKGSGYKVKIVDFGIARLSKQGLDSQTQTATGMIFGTPFYMSPEQCQGLKVDERSDIYSLGCALFEALTGAPPFRGENAFQTFMMHQSKVPPRLQDRAPRANYPQALQEALEKMLAKNADHRYQQMQQVKQDLQSIRAGRHTSTAEQNHIVSTSDYPKAQPSKFPTKLVATLAVAAITVGAYFAFAGKTAPAPSKAAAHKVRAEEEDEDIVSMADFGHLVRKFGGSEQEIAYLNDYDFKKADYEQREVGRQFDRFAQKKTRFLNKEGNAFVFPSGVVLGELVFDDNKPQRATDEVKIPVGTKDICFHQNFCLRNRPQFVDLFGPDDLTGLQMVQAEPDKVIAKIKNWKRLKTLSFFEPLTKPLPGWDDYDQSRLKNSDLQDIDQFRNLETLGLCGHVISAEKITQMNLFRTVKSLRLKSLLDLDVVLKELPALDNLNEVWLISNGVTDDQLECLTQMKNLESLRITRSRLTPESLSYFKRMPKLKHLALDRNWSEADKNKFRAAMPFIQFESLLDFTYWPVMIGKSNK